MSDQFEWDEQKAIANVRKHGISFEEATEVLADPDAVVILDVNHSLQEARFKCIGLSSKGILAVIFVERQNGNVSRIISARYADRQERDLYYEKKKN